MYKCPNRRSISSNLDSIGVVSSAQSVLSVASTTITNHEIHPIPHHMSRSSILRGHTIDSQSSDFSSGNESTTALLQHQRSHSRDELVSHQRSISRCRNPSVNWSSNEGSIETMSVAISEMTDGLHQLELNQ